MPLRRHDGWTTSQLTYQLLLSLIQGAVLLLIGWVAGARYAGGPGGMAVALLASLMLAAAFCSVSAAVALTARDQTALIGISTLVVLPATFLSTALMPVALLPHWVEAAARYNPLTWATELARTAMSSAIDGGVVASRGLLLLALATVTYAWSVAAMHRHHRTLYPPHPRRRAPTSSSRPPRTACRAPGLDDCVGAGDRAGAGVAIVQVRGW